MPFRMPNNRCLGCNKLVDAASNMFGKDGPGPNDLTVCMYCGRLMMFNADLSFRDLTGKETLEAMMDTRVQRMMQAREWVMKGRKQ